GNLLDQSRVGPAPPGRDTRRRMLREAAYVKFVDHRFGKRPPERDVPLPVVLARISDDALHRHGRVWAKPARGGSIVTIRNGHRHSLRIEEQLLGVESKAAVGREWPVSPVGIHLSGRKPGYEHVPVVIRAMSVLMERDDLGRPGAVAIFEQ